MAVSSKGGQLGHIEENVHILFIIIGVGSCVIILAAIVRHWWKKRRLAESQQRQERQASLHRMKGSGAACQVKMAGCK